jgi:hypothetical protein
MDFIRLTPEAHARAVETKRWQEDKAAQLASMSIESLVANAKFYARQMDPIDYAPGEPVYGATMWHVILPELLKRLENGR